MNHRIMVIVDPGPLHPAEAATFNHLHQLVKGRFDRWWHHIDNVYIVESELDANGVFVWLNRVWPVPTYPHTLTAKTASATSSVLVVDITDQTPAGRLASWAWFEARP